MAFLLKEKELANLDKQTLIKMLVAATESNQKLFEATEQLQKPSDRRSCKPSPAPVWPFLRKRTDHRGRRMQPALLRFQ